MGIHLKRTPWASISDDITYSSISPEETIFSSVPENISTYDIKASTQQHPWAVSPKVYSIQGLFPTLPAQPIILGYCLLAAPLSNSCHLRMTPFPKDFIFIF